MLQTIRVSPFLQSEEGMERWSVTMFLHTIEGVLRQEVVVTKGGGDKRNSDERTILALN